MIGNDGIRNSNGKPGTQGRDLPGEWLYIVPLALSLLISRFLFAIPDSPGAVALHMLVYACTTCVAALLFVPVSPPCSLKSLSALSGRCGVATVLFLAAVLADSQTRGAIGQALPLALMVFLLTLATLAPVLAIGANAALVRQCVFVVFAILLATPVWLAPLAEQAGIWPGAPDLIIGVSPLSALAVSLDFDYLRSNWFYQYSVLGSLRYEYLSWSAYVLILATTIAGLVTGATKLDVDRARRADNRVLNQLGNGVTNS